MLIGKRTGMGMIAVVLIPAGSALWDAADERGRRGRQRTTNFDGEGMGKE